MYHLPTLLFALANTASPIATEGLGFLNLMVRLLLHQINSTPPDGWMSSLTRTICLVLISIIRLSEQIPMRLLFYQPKGGNDGFCHF
jgi:hypothetical protein